MTDDRDITDDVMEQWREICEESHAQLEKECEDLEMTDEEMAEEYCNDEVPFDTTESGEKLYTENDLKHAYLAGLKAGRPKWHKVADGDLPKESEFLKNEPDNHRYECFIVATVGNPYRALYSFAKKKWFIDYEEMMIGTCYFEPIAWCEIPKYTEEI